MNYSTEARKAYDNASKAFEIYKQSVLDHHMEEDDMNTVKVFISVPMRGRSDEDIKNDIHTCKRAYRGVVNGISPDTNIIFVDNFVEGGTIGSAIDKLIKCDACVFIEGAEASRGCRLEHEVCIEYDIPRFHADNVGFRYILEREIDDEPSDAITVTSYDSDMFTDEQKDVIDGLIRDAFEAGRQINS